MDVGYDSVYNSPQDNVSQYEELYGELKDSAFEPKKEKSPYRRLLMQVRSPFSTPKARSPTTSETKGNKGAPSGENTVSAEEVHNFDNGTDLKQQSIPFGGVRDKSFIDSSSNPIVVNAENVGAEPVVNYEAPISVTHSLCLFLDKLICGTIVCGF